MQLDILLDNILSPAILFFALGVAARLLKSDLSIPEAISKLFSLYLLWAIGFKGGVSLREEELTFETVLPLLAAVGLSFVLPIVAVPVLRLRFSVADACATAAAFGSVSVVTFIAAVNFMQGQGVQYSGQLVAALALMESPAIITAVIMHRVLSKKEKAGDAAAFDLKELLSEALLGGAVFLLLGSMLVGFVVQPDAADKLSAFSEDIFQGVLVLFMIDAGMRAAERLGELGKNTVFAVMASLVLALINAALGLLVSWMLGLSVGDAALLTTLSASASYIAVPAAMRLAIPEANSSVYLPIALGIVFPFNVAIGIPLYLGAARAILG